MANIIKKEDLKFLPKNSENPYIRKPKVENVSKSNPSIGDKLVQLNARLEKQERERQEKEEQEVARQKIDEDIDEDIVVGTENEPEQGLRIGRIKYISHSIWFGVGTGVLLAIVPPVAIITLIALLVSTKRRLNDLNKSGIGSFLILIPIVGFIFGLYLYFAKGDEGINDYGEPPTLSALDIVFFILSLLAPFAVIAIVFVVVMSGASF